MSSALFILAATLFLAYSNGANDTFKGVATIYGSKTASFKTSLAWAIITTFAGSIAALFVGTALVQQFSGNGLVPPTVAASPNFLLAVILGAGITVLLASFLGFPISTTHSLTGALVGAGFVAVGMQISFEHLGQSFILPLILSPVLAVGLGFLSYLTLHGARIRLGIPKELCVCAGEPQQVIPVTQLSVMQGAATLPAGNMQLPQVSIGTTPDCVERYTGRMVGITTQQLLDVAHFISAGVVSFARGLNDTPKIVALLVATQLLAIEGGMMLVAVAMTIGGLINARKVAETMSTKITPLNPGQGFTANLMTGLLVILASTQGLPVSTTHVSVGAITGIGLMTRQANLRVITGILLAWILTLPIASISSALIALVLRALNF